MKRPSVVLADEHLLVLEGLQKILESDVEVVGVAQQGRTLVELSIKVRPDLIISDIGLPLLNGIDAVTRIKRSVPKVRALLVARQWDRHRMNLALRAGISGYLVKDCSGSEVRRAIQEVLLGRSYVTPLITAEFLSNLRQESQSTRRLDLTERQREVLQLIVEGHAAKEIASLLEISPKTVEYHKYAIMQSLGVRTTADLIRHALERGLTVPSQR